MSSGKGEVAGAAKGRKFYKVAVTGIQWLADKAFEIRFQRPEDGFDFLAGQKIGVLHDDVYRDYSLTGSLDGSDLAICVRLISGGELSTVLARAKKGDMFHISQAFGYFLYQPSRRPAVFAATGTGIAPFVAFIRAGARPGYLLHGVRSTSELYYHELLSQSAKQYSPCLSGAKDSAAAGGEHFHGRVTDFLEHELSRGEYDFYLCGRSEMLRDATRIIDRHFDGSRVYSELFF